MLGVHGIVVLAGTALRVPLREGREGAFVVAATLVRLPERKVQLRACSAGRVPPPSRASIAATSSDVKRKVSDSTGSVALRVLRLQRDAAPVRADGIAVAPDGLERVAERR